MATANIARSIWSKLWQEHCAEADKAHSLNPLPKADGTGVSSTALFSQSIDLTIPAYVLTQAK